MNEDHKTWADVVYNSTPWITVSGAILAGWNKAVDKYWDYKLKFFDARTAKMIDEKLDNKVTPEINKLSQAIDELKEAIWEMKKK